MKTYKNPDYVFNYSLELASKNGSLTLYDGPNYHHDSDDMDDRAVLDWAQENEMLSEEDSKLYKKGKFDSIDIKPYREALRDHEIEWDSLCSPEGRVFSVFETEGFYYDEEEDGIEFVDGPAPGNNYQCVSVDGVDVLERLQAWILEECGKKVNFIEFTEVELRRLMQE